MVEEADLERTAVYRLFDAHGTLLYVGVTSDPLRRWAAERYAHEWWAAVVQHKCEWYDTRKLALAVEAQAIRAEKPLHNVDGRRLPRSPKTPPLEQIWRALPAEDLPDRVRRILGLSLAAGAKLLLVAAALEGVEGDLPRGSALARLAGTAGISVTAAYRHMFPPIGPTQEQ